ncbi:hypothetical protein JGU66_32960 [Myxococcaceae bacterium JPH2]|nr:hypothetical protein [Myxococcaceae bacterium JPH2]
MSRACVLLALVLACACGSNSASLPAPEILSLVPNSQRTNEKGELTVSFDAVYAVRVDYGREQVSSEQAASGRVWVGGVEARVVRFDAAGTVVVTVPEELGPGEYEVKLVLADGREAVAQQVFAIRTPGESDPPAKDHPDAGPVDAGSGSDAGAQEDDPALPLMRGDVTGYVFTSVDSVQYRNESFTITVEARGPRAAEFNDWVLLVSTRGTVTPSLIGPFSKGRCTQRVSVDVNGGNVKLIAFDFFGARGASNGFQVRHRH